MHAIDYKVNMWFSVSLTAIMLSVHLLFDRQVWQQGTHIIAAIADAFPGPLPHDEQVHLCSSGTGTAQTLPAAIGWLSHLGVPAKPSKAWIQCKSVLDYFVYIDIVTGLFLSFES